MPRCVACLAEVPENAKYCGYCGFKQEPIARERHRELSDSFARHAGALPAADGDPAPLTRPKGVPDDEPPLSVMEPVPLGSRTGGERGGAGGALAPVPDSALPTSIAFEDTVSAGSLDDTLPNRALDPDAALPAPAGEPPGRPSRRQARRFPLKVEVGMTSEHNFYTGFAENLSSGGLFVATHDPWQIGDSIEISLAVPGLGRTCSATCEVRWLREYDPQAPDMVPGIGLRFLDLDAEARAAIELFLRHRDPIFYDED